MADNDRNHPAQPEPRSYGQAHHHPDAMIRFAFVAMFGFSALVGCGTWS